MREKLLNLMKNEGLKPSQLAEMLEINPAGVSHILAGRNKPGFDLLQKILRRFPQINPDWLLLDSPKMYRDNTTDGSAQLAMAQTGQRTSSSTTDLFNTEKVGSDAQTAGKRQLSPEEMRSMIGGVGGVENSGRMGGNALGGNFPGGGTASATGSSGNGMPGGTLPGIGTTVSPVAKVVVFYEDKTFECFIPRCD